MANTKQALTTAFGRCLSTLARVKKLFGKYQPLPPKSYSEFEKLPVEIVLCITDFLAEVDYTSLALSSCAMWCTLRLRLGPFFRTKLNLDINDDRQELLIRLSRDNTELYFCFLCERLHKLDCVLPPLRYPYEMHLSKFEALLPQYYFNAGIYAHDYGFGYRLAFVHVQVVLQRHRLDLHHGLSTNELAVMRVAAYPVRGPKCKTFISIDAQIVQNQLYLRVQKWHIYGPGQMIGRLQYKAAPSICQHVNRWNITYTHLYKCKLEHDNLQPSCETCAPSLACVHCGTEFVIKHHDLGREGSAIVVTQWMNLGHGMSPSDEHWRSKLESPHKVFNGRLSPIQEVDPRSGNQWLFETVSEKSATTLTAEVSSLLRGDKYRKTFRKSQSNCWIYDSRARQRGSRT